MADYLFVSQDMIDSWVTDGKVDLDGRTMSIRGEDRRYSLEPAVRFVRVSCDEPDIHGLVAKVKGLAQLEQEGAELCHNSVLVGDVAYEVQNGYIARVEGRAAELEPSSRQSATTTASAAGSLDTQAVAAGDLHQSEQAAPPPAEASDEQPVAEAAAEEPKALDEGEDAELLTRFLLDHLR